VCPVYLATRSYPPHSSRNVTIFPHDGPVCLSVCLSAGEYLVRNGIHTFAVSESQKIGHVTFFWNGNRSGELDKTMETYLEVRTPCPAGPSMTEMNQTSLVLIRQAPQKSPRPLITGFSALDELDSLASRSVRTG
jgi:Metalloenzyme superfamily